MVGSVLVVCGCCSRHIRPNEPRCPFCGLTLEDAQQGVVAPSPWYAIAAVSATIVLSGCPAMMTRYGAPPSPTPAVSPPGQDRESRDIYGAPPPPSQVRDGALPMQMIHPAPGVNPAQGTQGAQGAENAQNSPENTDAQPGAVREVRAIYGAPPPRSAR
jgi:hypothetical protein